MSYQSTDSTMRPKLTFVAVFVFVFLSGRAWDLDDNNFFNDEDDWLDDENFFNDEDDWLDDNKYGSTEYGSSNKGLIDRVKSLEQRVTLMERITRLQTRRNRINLQEVWVVMVSKIVR